MHRRSWVLCNNVTSGPDELRIVGASWVLCNNGASGRNELQAVSDVIQGSQCAK